MEGTHPLKEWRAANGLTQEAAAERLGVSEPDISRWENRRRMPSLTQAAKLSEMTGIPIEQFAQQAEAAE